MPNSDDESHSSPVEIVGYTTGVFDMFHIGHLNVLQRAREHCDRLIAGVTTDELCESRKGRLPLIPWEERAAIVAGIRHVDKVVPQTTMDKLAAWRQLQFDVMFVGDDWRGTDAWIEYESQFAPFGVRIHYLPHTPHRTSTMLRNQVLG